MEKYKTAIILITLSALALFLRLYLMPGNLFFGPEQGRDLLVIRDIAENHKLTLIGSKTDISGIFHGPLFYYLGVIPFIISDGNPYALAVFFIFLQALSVFFIYILLYELTGKKRAGFIAALLFAVSFLPIVYARWLSNPPLSLPLSILFLLFLNRFVRRSSWSLLGVAVTYGLLGQAEFINFLLFGCIGLGTILIYRKTFLKTPIHIYGITIVIGFIISFASYLIFDLRHDFLITKAVVGLIQGKSGYQVAWVDSVRSSFHVLWEQISLMVGLDGRLVGGILFFVMGYIALKYKLILLWVLVPPILFAVLRHSMLIQLYAGVICGFLVLLSIVINQLTTKNRFVGSALLIGVVVLNLCAIYKYFPNNDRVFFQVEQKKVTYRDQLAVIDWVYQTANNRPFEFQAYTIPYFMQDAWIYLFNWQGQKKYGYSPTPVNRKLLYVIIQSDILNPSFQKDWYDKTVSTWGQLTNDVTIGDFKVEERVSSHE